MVPKYALSAQGTRVSYSQPTHHTIVTSPMAAVEMKLASDTIVLANAAHFRRLHIMDRPVVLMDFISKFENNLFDGTFWQAGGPRDLEQFKHLGEDAFVPYVADDGKFGVAVLLKRFLVNVLIFFVI